jgi:hypothetical protein
MMHKINVELTLSDELLTQLEKVSASSNMSLDAVIVAAVEDYLLDDDEDFEDESDEEILESFTEGFREALMDNVRPAREVLAEIKRELGMDS